MTFTNQDSDTFSEGFLVTQTQDETAEVDPSTRATPVVQHTVKSRKSTIKPRKSVIFHSTVSLIPGPSASDPAAEALPPTTPTRPPKLDPMYLTWLHRTTRAAWPLIRAGTFTQHLYRQNFDEHLKMTKKWMHESAERRQAKLPVLAERYGPLGWGSLYRDVGERAWVKSYRLIWSFDWSDEELLEKIAEAYAEIKKTLVEEDITRVTEFNDENASIQGKAEALGSVVGFGPGVVSLDISALPDAVVQKDVIRKEVEGGDGDGGATMLEADFVRRGFGGLQAGGECLRRGVPGFTVDGVVG